MNQGVHGNRGSKGHTENKTNKTNKAWALTLRSRSRIIYTRTITNSQFGSQLLLSPWRTHPRPLHLHLHLHHTHTHTHNHNRNLKQHYRRHPRGRPRLYPWRNQASAQISKRSNNISRTIRKGGNNDGSTPLSDSGSFSGSALWLWRCIGRQVGVNRRWDTFPGTCGSKRKSQHGSEEEDHHCYRHRHRHRHRWSNPLARYLPRLPCRQQPW